MHSRDTMSGTGEVSPAERRLSQCALILVGLTPLLAFFSTPGLAPLLICAAILMLAIGPRARILAEIPRGPAILVAVFLSWAVVTALWAVEPATAVRRSGQLLVLFAAGLVWVGASRVLLSGSTSRRAVVVLGGAVVIVVALFIFEGMLGGPLSPLLGTDKDADTHIRLTRYNRAATVIAILLAPAVAGVIWQYGWRWGLLLALGGLVGLLLMHSRTAVIGAIISLCVSAVALRWPVLVHRLVIAGFVVALLSPFYMGNLIPSDPGQMAALREGAIRHQVFSAFHRLRIWEFAVNRIDERPLLGWGLDSSRALPGGKVVGDAGGEQMSLHPHNGPIQVRLELGIPGILLASGLVLWPLIAIRQAPPRARAAILGAATALIVVSSLSYGMWQSWWVAALWLFAGLIPLVLADAMREA